ncbi:unnamed protein product, partial [Rotaria sordida]
NLRKIRAFVSNATLRNNRQNEVRSKCLQLWKLDNGIENVLLNTPNLFKNSLLDQHQIESLFDYRCVYSLDDSLLLLSCGRSSVFAMELRNKDKQWIPLERIQFRNELPPYTLLLAERVQEQFND